MGVMVGHIEASVVISKHGLHEDYGRAAFELPSRQVLSLDSILNLFSLLRPDFDALICIP